MQKIILASQSPRRKELMKLINIDFTVISSNIEESIDKSLSIEAGLKKLAYQKAQAIYKLNKDSIVIGSDSIVYQDKQILNKPKSKEEAFKMIKSYSNNSHQVMTTVSIISKDKTKTILSKCEVFFNQISDEEIEEYLKLADYKDKAGAYGIQGLMAKFIKRVEGDYYAVVGFPISRVYQLLKNDFKVI